MLTFPPEFAPLVVTLVPVFTHPTLTRFTVLLVAAVLTPGRHTIANLLRTLGELVPGHPTSYQRVLSSARWSLLELGCALIRFLLHHVLPDGPITLVVDDTVESHPGRKVSGKGRHRDPVRSSHTFTAWKYGHKWVVVAVLVQFPWATRRWALPILVDLYRTRETNRAENRRHRTPAQLTKRLLRTLLIRFPNRRLILVGDSAYGSHELARFCRRHHARLTLVSKLCPQANFCEPPPAYSGRGRPRVTGPRCLKAAAVVAQTPASARTMLTVRWYGGGTREVAIVTGVAHWFQSGHGLVPLVWVFVQDRTGTHRDEYVYATDPTLTPIQILDVYTGRWNLETTFQECRSVLGLETTCGWCESTVVRMAPCEFGLYTMIAILYGQLADSDRVRGVSWPGKTDVTFSDAVISVRRRLWTATILPRLTHDGLLQQLAEPAKSVLLQALSRI
jgi:hypothetical protein